VDPIERLMQIQEEQGARLAVIERDLRRVRTVLVCLICLLVGLPLVGWLVLAVSSAKGAGASAVSSVGPVPALPADEDKTAEAKADEATLASELDAFYLDCGRYPTNEEGLNALVVPPPDLAIKWKGPYGKGVIPVDPWGNQYVYQKPGAKGGNLSITSYGSDGKPGGVLFGADIVYTVQ
jgi:general secretion pathway protein G